MGLRWILPTKHSAGSQHQGGSGHASRGQRTAPADPYVCILAAGGKHMQKFFNRCHVGRQYTKPSVLHSLGIRWAPRDHSLIWRHRNSYTVELCKFLGSQTCRIIETSGSVVVKQWVGLTDCFPCPLALTVISKCGHCGAVDHALLKHLHAVLSARV